MYLAKYDDLLLLVRTYCLFALVTRWHLLLDGTCCFGPKDGAAIRARINPRTHIITRIPTSSVCLWVHYFPCFFLSLSCLLRLHGGHAFCTSGLLGLWLWLWLFGSRSLNGGGSCGPLQLGRSWACKGDVRDSSCKLGSFVSCYARGRGVLLLVIKTMGTLGSWLEIKTGDVPPPSEDAHLPPS